MSRYQYTRYHDGIHWIVVDTARRETVGFATCAWDAGKCADHLNRGLPVYLEPQPEPDLAVRWPRVLAGAAVLVACGWTFVFGIGAL